MDALAFGAWWRQLKGRAASKVLARAHGKQELTLSVNARHAWALERLLRWGYRVERTMARMVLKGRDEGPSTDGWGDLLRWAG